MKNVQLRACLGLAIAILLYGGIASAQLYINEVMPDNDTIIADPQGQYDDWIEIYNAGTQAVDIGGMHITDDLGNPDKCQIPTDDPAATTIPAGGYLLIWADNDSEDGATHVEFGLDAAGEEVGLVDENGSTIIDSLVFGPIDGNQSHGRYPDANTNWYIMVTPTPGSANTLPPASPIEFSITGGAYTNSSITLVLSSAEPGASIRYTTDGTAPTNSSTEYTLPLTITNTTWIRARGYESGKSPGIIRTEAYMMVDSSAASFSSDLPIMIMDDLGFDHEANRVRVFEPSYFVIIDTNSSGRTTFTNATSFAGYGGAHARGASSYGATKVNLAVELWTQDNQDRDASLLGMPPDSDWALYGPYSAFFDNKILCDNVFGYEMFRQMGHYAPRTRYVELFMNSDQDKIELESGYTTRDYHGIYVLMERVKRGQDRVDIEQLDWSDDTEPAISGGYIFKREQTATEFTGGGEGLLFHEPPALEMNNEMTTQRDWLVGYLNEFNDTMLNSNYPAVLEYIDERSWVDYHLLISFTKCRDEMTKSRYTHKDRNGKLKMGPTWDYDGALDGEPSGWDGAGEGGGGTGIWTTSWWHKDTGLFKFYDFWQAWVDRYFELRRDVFSETNLVAVMDGLSNQLWEAHFRNAQRWVPSYYPNRQTWLTQRVAWMDDQFPEVPSFSRTNDSVAVGYNLVLSGAGTIYYTLDGTDPRGTNGILGASAKEYSGFINITSNVIVRARTWSGAAWTMPPDCPWSAPNDTTLAVTSHSVAVTEVMYHPRDPEAGTAETNYSAGDFEFVEITNIGDERCDLAGLRFTDGIDYDWSYGSVRSLAPGESALTVENLEAFKIRYPGWASMNVSGQYRGNLSDGGERIKLASVWGTTNALFEYNDSRDWPQSADGAGHSIVPLILTNQGSRILDYGGNWRPSNHIDGSPGETNAAPSPSVVLNEIVAHTDYSNPSKPEYDSNDWIELFNAASTNVNLTDWYLSDSASDLRKWLIPTGTVIALQSFLSFDEVDHFHSPITNGFGLNKASESLFLSHLPAAGPGRVVDSVRFKGQENGIAWGRYPDGDRYWQVLSATRDAQNSEPDRHVRISEIMYNPVTNAMFPTNNTNDEFIELFNPAPSNVPMWNTDGPWRLDGVGYTFPSNTTIDAGEAILVVSFDPMTNVAAATAFSNAYVVPPGGMRMFGPCEKLDNRGERIAIERPQAPDGILEPASWVVIDEVTYFDQWPWNPAADGISNSLHRTAFGNYTEAGNDPSTWEAAVANPGVPDAKVLVTDPVANTRFFVPFVTNVAASIFTGVEVTQVEFFANGQSIGIDTNEPYEVSWGTNVTDGSYYLTAVLTDADGVYTSAAPMVMVYGPPVNGLWAKRMKLTFPGYTPGETLTNFPVMVELSETLSGFSYEDFGWPTNAADLRFGDSALASSLPYELEKWDTNGDSIVWVKIPELTASTEIWAYWGNPVASNAPWYRDDGTVWTEDFEGVWHFSGDVNDSTMQRTAQDLGPTNAPNGSGGDCLGFDGTDDYVAPSITRSWFAQNTSNMTIMAWAKPSGAGNLTVFGSRNEDPGSPSLSKYLHIKQNGANWDFGVGFFTDLTLPVDSGQWQMLVLAVNAGGNIFNGYRNTTATTDRIRPANTAPDYDPVIGYLAGDTDPGYWYNGLIDEFRVSTTRRSDAWLWAVWTNMVPGSDFVTFDPAEDTPGGGAPADDDDDEMADAWEISYFSATNAVNGGANEDWDGDGYLNLWEYIAGTDPTDKESYFALSIVYSNGQWVVCFPAFEAIGTGYTGLDRLYDLENRTNLLLGDWVPIIDYTNILGDNTEVVHTNVTPQRVYYRSRTRLE